MNDGHLLQQAALAEAQRNQRQAYLNGLHRMTSQQIYTHLAAMNYQRTMMRVAHEADPMGLGEPVAIEPVFDASELKAAADFSQFAATVYMVAIGEFKPEALNRYQKKE
jgi:hypothetical protein